MTQLYFIRHGESTANRDKICAGHMDVALTDVGVQQARFAGQMLSKSGVTIDCIVSSPLVRALETAKCIALAIDYPVGNIRITELAMERYRGRFEGLPSSAQQEATDKDYEKMGAESVTAMIERARALQSYINSLGVNNVLLVSHNQFGQVFTGIWRGEQPKEQVVDKLPNAEVFKV